MKFIVAFGFAVTVAGVTLMALSMRPGQPPGLAVAGAALAAAGIAATLVFGGRWMLEDVRMESPHADRLTVAFFGLFALLLAGAGSAMLVGTGDHRFMVSGILAALAWAHMAATRRILRRYSAARNTPVKPARLRPRKARPGQKRRR